MNTEPPTSASTQAPLLQDTQDDPTVSVEGNSHAGIDSSLHTGTGGADSDSNGNDSAGRDYKAQPHELDQCLPQASEYSFGKTSVSGADEPDRYATPPMPQQSQYGQSKSQMPYQQQQAQYYMQQQPPSQPQQQYQQQPVFLPLQGAPGVPGEPRSHENDGQNSLNSNLNPVQNLNQYQNQNLNLNPDQPHTQNQNQIQNQIPNQDQYHNHNRSQTGSGSGSGGGSGGNETANGRNYAEANNDRNHVVIKVGMVGDAQIGKTSLMVKYVEGSWDEDYIQTLGVNFMEKTISIRNTEITFSIWDLGGQREFVNMLPLVCNDAVAILFMFDLTRKSTLNSIKEWYRQGRGFNKTAIPILVGTKYDHFVNFPREDQEEISNQARRFAKAMRAALIFSSTSHSINVQKIFKIVLAKAFDLKCTIPEIENVGEPLLLYQTC